MRFERQAVLGDGAFAEAGRPTGVYWDQQGRRLAVRPAAVWPYAETITREFNDEPRAQYAVTFEPDKHHIAAINDGPLFENRYPSAQPSLRELGTIAWHRVLRCRRYQDRRKPTAVGQQPHLLPPEEA